MKINYQKWIPLLVFVQLILSIILLCLAISGCSKQTAHPYKWGPTRVMPSWREYTYIVIDTPFRNCHDRIDSLGNPLIPVGRIDTSKKK